MDNLTPTVQTCVVQWSTAVSLQFGGTIKHTIAVKIRACKLLYFSSSQKFIRDKESLEPKICICSRHLIFIAEIALQKGQLLQARYNFQDYPYHFFFSSHENSNEVFGTYQVHIGRCISSNSCQNHYFIQCVCVLPLSLSLFFIFTIKKFSISKKE